MLPTDQLDATFFALADPTRRTILARLAAGEASVSELVEPFDMTQPAISKHLKVLERAGLVSVGRDGARRPRRLEPEPLEAATEWIERYREIWEASFRRLDALLEEMKAAEAQSAPRHETSHAARPDERPDRSPTMSKITPFLWFDAPLSEPLAYYRSIFPSMKVLRESDVSAAFEIEGQRFNALNGGPKYRFNEAVSFFVDCEDQAEVDYYWDRLTEEGEESMCGWLKDKYGLSWQIIPKTLGRLLGDPDREKADRVMQAMLQMQKIDVATLERAAAGG